MGASFRFPIHNFVLSSDVGSARSSDFLRGNVAYARAYFSRFRGDNSDSESTQSLGSAGVLWAFRTPVLYCLSVVGTYLKHYAVETQHIFPGGGLSYFNE